MTAGAAITGLGGALPATELTNAELVGRLEDIDESWIVARTGIKSRRVAGPGDTSSGLAVKAARKALDEAGVEPTALDYVICATVTPDYQFPACASLIQHALGANRAAAFDLGAGCSGFLYALAQSVALVESGAAKQVLVCGVDILSRLVNFQDSRSCVLFGDGAGAVVVQRVDGPSDFGPFVLRSDGSIPELLWIPPESKKIAMNGREVYKRAVDGMTTTVREVLETGGLSADDGCMLVAHQANARILEAVAERLHWPREQVIINIGHLGNTSSASIPLALDEARRTRRLDDGDMVVLTAFGAGFAWGAGLMRWRMPAPAFAEETAREAAHV